MVESRDFRKGKALYVGQSELSPKCQTGGSLENRKQADVPPPITQAQMSAFIEEYADVLIGELVTEAVFVGVVDPLGYPDKRLGFGKAGWVF